METSRAPVNPYHEFAASFLQLLAQGKSLPLGNFAAPARPTPPSNAPRALIFSPHPDDECIIGGLALRLLREAGMRVLNVAVTQGSNRDRQRDRWEELMRACHWLGFELEATAPNGLEKVTAKTRQDDPQHWNACVQTIAALLTRHQPRAVFFPHESDWNSTHVGTHFLVMDALQSQPPAFETILIETEFWGQMTAPNLMVESGIDDVADLLAALSFHAGEVRRNPYHLRLPPWLMDNVRRGAELVGGQGSAAPDFVFATLYRARQWKNRRIEAHFSGGKQIGKRDSAAALFSPAA